MLQHYSKTLDERDYDLFTEMHFIEKMKEGLSGTFYPCHRHRNWEYGLCLKALIENKTISVLEVGGTGSPFAASAAWLGMQVTVIDPLSGGARLFAAQNMILQLGHAPITFKQVDFFQYQSQKKYDAVVCLSTLEHVLEDECFFERLLSLVKEEGILFITVDFHPSGQRLVQEHLRTYNQERLGTFITIAKNRGFDLFGEGPDYSWRGESVYNYTFASLALKRRKRQEVPAILFVNNHKNQKDGVYQFGKRVGAILQSSQKCRFIYFETDAEEEYWKKVDQEEPGVIIYNLHSTYNMPWVNSAVLKLTQARGIALVSIFHDRPAAKGFDYYITTYPHFPENEIVFSTPRPLLEYENSYPTSSEIPVINCFGFTGSQNFVQLAQMVNCEFDMATLNFHLPFNDMHFGSSPVAEAEACRAAITKKGIHVNITHAFMSDAQLLDFLAQGSLNVFLYYEQKGRGCASTLDFALSVKRPIAITKSNMMAHIYQAQPSICIEDRSLKEIMASGFGPLEPYYEKWRPAKLVQAYERIVEQIL